MNETSPQSPLRPESPGLHRAVMDAFPSPVFIVDEDARILEANGEACREFPEASSPAGRKLCGFVLNCVHTRTTGDCGKGPTCQDCPVRQTIAAVRDSGRGISRKLSRMHLKGDASPEGAWFMVTVTPLVLPERPLYLLVMEDVSELMHLRRIIPMCASCHKVRDDRSYWENVEAYLDKHTRISFSHGICPDCMRKLYPEFADEVSPNPEAPAPKSA